MQAYRLQTKAPVEGGTRKRTQKRINICEVYIRFIIGSYEKNREEVLSPPNTLRIKHQTKKQNIQLPGLDDIIHAA